MGKNEWTIIGTGIAILIVSGIGFTSLKGDITSLKGDIRDVRKDLSQNVDKVSTKLDEVNKEVSDLKGRVTRLETLLNGYIAAVAEHAENDWRVTGHAGPSQGAAEQ